MSWPPSKSNSAWSGAAIRKYDPNHLNLGIRFGGNPSEEVLRTGRVFNVCSINVYEYEPTKQVERTYRITGRPVLIGEFHFGVPADGLGAGLVQTRDQIERGKGYRYFVEQAAALPGFLGRIGSPGATNRSSAAWTARTTTSASST